MIEETRWIWNKGIASLCDHRLPDDFPKGVYRFHGDSFSRSTTSYYQTLAGRVSDGDLVWVKVDWLPFFVSTILPDIDARFVLATGDSDHSMPSTMPVESERICSSSMVIHWYTQNFDGTVTDKISPIPIGIDFHTIQREEYWGIRKLPIAKQNEVLNMIQQKLKPVDKRIQQLYIDSQFDGRCDPFIAGATNDLTRSAIYKMIKSCDDVFLQKHFLPQFEMWKQRGLFAFVLSHHGNGLDCHRTWEALVLGHIVVIQKSSLDPLYEELPVIFVDDWRDVDTASLGDLLCIDQEKAYRLEKLTNQYWVDRMRLMSQRALKI